MREFILNVDNEVEMVDIGVGERERERRVNFPLISNTSFFYVFSIMFVVNIKSHFCLCESAF